MAELSVYDNDPTLYLFTSLTAGSSHIVTATSRIETILKANKIPFKGVDTATDELARKLYGRRARGKKLPLLVKEGYVIADLEQIEEWNEYDELKDVLGGPAAPAPVAAAKAAPAPAESASDKKENEPSTNAEQNLAIRQLGAEAAKVAAAKKHVPENISTTNPRLTEKVNSPAVGTPTKKSTDTSGILSPRAIPLPATPNPAVSSPTSSKPTASTPKTSSKPVHSPSTTHADAANPDPAAAPTSTTTSSSEEEDSEDEEEVVQKAEKAPVKEVGKPDGKDGREVGKSQGQSKEAPENEEESDEDSEDESKED